MKNFVLKQVLKQVLNKFNQKSYTEVHIRRLVRGYMQNLGP